MGKLDVFVDRIKKIEEELESGGSLDKYVVQLKVIKGKLLVEQVEAAKKKKKDDAHFVELASMDDLVRTLDTMIHRLETQLLEPHTDEPEDVPVGVEAKRIIGKERDEEREEELNAYSNDRPFDSVNPTLIVFYSEKCGHCHSFRPIWAELKRVYKDRDLNMLSVRGDGASVELMSMMKEFGITGYPTVVLVEPKSNKKVEFDDARTLSNLVHFIESNLP